MFTLACFLVVIYNRLVMFNKVLVLLIVALYFTAHLYGSMQVVESVSSNPQVESDLSSSQIQTSLAPADDGEQLEETEKSYVNQFFSPVINVIHFLLFLGLVLLYIRSRKLKRRLHRTRSKLHNQSVRFNHRLDHLTLEQKELKKIIKEYSEIQY